jgi:hypothetical protein
MHVFMVLGNDDCISIVYFGALLIGLIYQEIERFAMDETTIQMNDLRFRMERCIWAGWPVQEVDSIKVTLLAAVAGELPGDLMRIMCHHMAVGIADID